MMKRLLTIWILLSAMLLLFPVISRGATSNPDDEKAKQRKLLETALREYDSQDKAETLLGFIANSNPEIRNIAIEALQKLPAYYKLSPVLDALRNKSREARKHASEVLGTTGSPKAIIPLFNAVLNDPDEVVRQNALNSLLKLSTKEDLIIKFGSFLNRKDTGPYQIRAAGSLGEIGQGNDRAIKYLVRRMEITIWPPGPRAHIFFGDLFTYIKDFDVVQANAVESVAMGKPVIDTLYTGIVLDVRVAKIEEIRVVEFEIVCRSLKNISGRDFGPDTARWIDWWSAETKKTLAQRYEERKKEAANGADIGKLLELGVWCKYQKMPKEAVQEFVAVLAKDPANPLALTNLREMGFVLSHQQWQPIVDALQTNEILTHQLLNQLKTYNPVKRQEAMEELDKIEPICKLRPFIKTLQIDPVESVRVYVAEKLGEFKEAPVIPYLVKKSLEDESETVRNNALDSIKKIGFNESIPWYLYFLEHHPDETTLVRITEILATFGNHNKAVVTALLRKMNYQTANNPKIFPVAPAPIPLDKKQTLNINSTIIELPLIELPRKSPDRTTSEFNPMDSTRQQTQLKAISDALIKITGQDFGTDYVKWLRWWNTPAQRNKD